MRRDAARKNRHSSEDCSVLRVTADISFSRMSSTISQTESAIGGAFSRLQSTISTEGSSVRKFSRIPSSQTEGASGGFFLRRQSTMSTESCSAGKFSRTPSAVSTESFGFVRTKSKCSRVPSTNASADSCGFTRTKSKFSRAPSTESFGFARTRSYSDHDLRIPEFSSTSLETRAESTSTTASFARSFSTVLTLDSAANDDNFRLLSRNAHAPHHAMRSLVVVLAPGSRIWTRHAHSALHSALLLLDQVPTGPDSFCPKHPVRHFRSTDRHL